VVQAAASVFPAIQYPKTSLVVKAKYPPDESVLSIAGAVMSDQELAAPEIFKALTSVPVVT
jgi:hypothetical protein